MAKMGLVSRTTSDKEHVVVELHMDDKGLGHILLPAADTEGLIHQLAQHRSELVEAVSPDLDPGSRVNALINPRLKALTHELGVVIAVRHPGLGWLSFVLPTKESRTLGQFLMANSETTEDR